MESQNNDVKSNKNFSYYAFISYQHDDVKWAKWIQDQIESYSIPKSVRKQDKSLPLKTCPVFRDQTDLEAGYMLDSLKEKLDDSKFLIVVCSPNSANSPWVADEINYFRNSHDDDHIIPVIIGGEPLSGGELECFPAPLRDMPSKLYGISIPELGRWHSIIKIVSKLLGVQSSILWDRYRRSRFSKYIGLGLLLSVLVASMSFLLIYKWTKYEYYVDYVDKYGIPEGIHKLSSKEFSHRSFSYRFEYERIHLGEPHAMKWRLARVCHVNSYNKVTAVNSEIGENYNNRYPIQDFIYSSDGILKQVVVSDEREKQLLRFTYSNLNGDPTGIADIIYADEQMGVSSCKETNDLIPKTYLSNYLDERLSSSVRRIVFLRNKSGHVIRRTFHSNNDVDLESSATPNLHGYFGESYDLDSLGRTIQVQFLDKKDNPIVLPMGITGAVYAFDSLDNFVMTKYVGKYGEPVMCVNYWAIRKQEFDEFGNESKCSFFDTDSIPCICKGGYSFVTSCFDDHGNRIFESYYGPDEEHVKWGNDFVSISYSYDKSGNCIRICYLDESGKQSHRSSVSEELMKYDKNGNKIECKHFSWDGKLSCPLWGACIEYYKYDDKNHLLGESYYSDENKPDDIPFKGHRIEYKYDVRGNKIEEIKYDTLGNIFQRSSYIYDDKNNIIYSRHRNKSLNAIHPYTFASTRYSYDLSGNIIDEQFYDSLDLPTMRNGASHVVRKYDNRNRCFEINYYDTLGKYSNYASSFISDSCYRVQIKYDDYNRVIEKIKFALKSGDTIVHHHLSEYDSYGNKISQVILDQSGNYINTNQSAITTWKYDDFGNIVEFSRFSEPGKLQLWRNSYAIRKTSWNSQHHKTKVAYFGADGLPINVDGDASAEIRKYDKFGQLEERQFLDGKGNRVSRENGVSMIRYVYDETGMHETFYSDDNVIINDSLPNSVNDYLLWMI